MIKIAIIGLPNVGKTTFLNTISNSNLKTANFAGSTTKKHEVAFFYNGKTFLFSDLPGFNSMNTVENDLAKEAIHSLKSTHYDAILHIANAEFPYFSKLLDEELRKEFGSKVVTAMNFPSFKIKPTELAKNFEKIILFSSLSRNNCNQLLDIIINNIEEKPYTSTNLLTFKDTINSDKITKIIDTLALSKIFGIPLFLGIMFFIFWLSFVFGKMIGDDYLVAIFEFFIGLAEESTFLTPFFKALITSVLTGVGVVVGFMPTIIICITLISLLEQTGYITRICFLLDTFFEKFGLGGKSLIPLIVGAGCSITAYMSAKMINDPKEKFLTMIIIGFVPCTAKLAVFMLFCLALFGKNAPLAISIVYLSGFIFGLICAKIIGLFIKGSAVYEKTKIEIFNYRLPQMKNVLKTGYSRTLDYLKNAATFIAIFASIISFLGLVGFEGGKFIILPADNLSISLIGKLGEFLVPVFAPMDFDFRMIISLITGLIAKEAAVATLAVLYATTPESLADIINAEVGIRHAITYLVFMFFYLPCVSATASFHREVKSWKKTSFLIIFTTILAYGFAAITNLLFLAF
jgi:ferrous iron transport protein B